MKRAYWMQMLVLVLAILATAAPSWAKTKKSAAKTETKTAKKDATRNADKSKKEKDEDDDSLFPKTNKDDKNAKDGVEINPDLEGLYAEMAEVVQLDKEGQEKLLGLQEKKNKALKTFDRKSGKLIVGIENELDRTRNEKKKAKLLKDLAAIEEKRRKGEQNYDNLAMRVLSREQKVIWNAYELWAVISPELEFDNEELELTEEQVEKSKKLCNLVAQRKGTKQRIAVNAQWKKMTLIQIGKEVLSKEQRAALEQQRKQKQRREKSVLFETRTGRGHH
jgi:hypothetical protein